MRSLAVGWEMEARSPGWRRSHQDRARRFVRKLLRVPVVVAETIRIFATFLIQEIGTLALRSDPKETMTRALSLTSDLLFDEEDPGINSLKIAERALIMYFFTLTSRSQAHK